MANIPLSDFPNAPSLAPVSAQIQTPAPNFDFGDLSGAFEALAQSQISGQALDTYGQGLNQLASGIADLGKFPARVAENIAATQNLADGERVNAILDNAYSSHLAAMETQGLPPGQWLPTWEMGLPEIKKQIDALGLSPMMRDQTAAKLIRYSSNAAINIKTAASKKGIEIDAGVTMDSAERAFSEGRYEDAHRLLNKGVELNLWPQQHADAKWLGWESTQRDENMSQYLKANPSGLARDMEEGIAAGSSKDFPWLTLDRMHSYQQKARTEEASQQSQMFANAQIDVAKDGVSDLEQLRQKYGASLPADRMKMLENTIKSHVTYDPAIHGPKIAEIRAEVLGYDGSQDPELKTMDELQRRISEVPRDKQAALSSLLSQSFQATARDGKEKPESERLVSYYSKEIIARGTSRLLGPTGRDPKNWDTVTDPAASSAYGIKLNNYLRSLENWGKAHPEATPLEMSDYVNQLIGADAKNAAIQQIAVMRKPWDYTVGGFSPSTYSAPNFARPFQAKDAHSPTDDDPIIRKIDSALPSNQTPIAPSPFDKKTSATKALGPSVRESLAQISHQGDDTIPL